MTKGTHRTSATATEFAAPSDVLLHPVVLVALGVWFLNDHFFKDLWPGLLTGKLSDVTGLMVCPLLVLGVFERCRASAPLHVRRRVLLLSIVTLALFMLGIKALDGAAFAYRWGLAALQWPLRAALATLRAQTLPALVPVALTMDPSDLWTLPSLAVPLWLVRARLWSPGRVTPQG